MIISESDQPHHTNLNRQAFMKLTMAERQKILAAQAEAMKDHYAQNTDWQDWVNLDINQPCEQGT